MVRLFLVLFFLTLFASPGELLGGEFKVRLQKFKAKTGQLMLSKPSGFNAEVGDLISLESGASKCSGNYEKGNNKFILLKIDLACSFLSRLQNGLVMELTLEGKDIDAGKEQNLIYTVESFSINTHTITARRIKNDGIKMADQVTLFSPSSQYCVLTIDRVDGSSFSAKTHNCKFEFEIRKGLRLEKKKSQAQRKDLPEHLKKYVQKYEDYYLHFGIGYPKLSYSGTIEKNVVDAFENDPNASRMTFKLDLLGIYFPVPEWKSMIGANFQIIADRFSNNNVSFDFYHIFASASAFYFPLKKSFGKKLLLKADIGLARQLSTVLKSTELGGVVNKPEKTGFGVGFGAGWGFDFNETSMWYPILEYSMRSTGDSKVTIISLTMGILF